MSDYNYWLLIDTAPKDGTWILVYKKFESYGFDKSQWDGTTFVVRWAYGTWYKCMEYSILDPTHWMPLPKPPTQ